MDTADLTPAPLRHIGGLFPAVRRMPSPPPDAGMLYAALCADFSDSDSLDYLADLARGVNAPIRLFALSLLPPLLSAAGVTSAGCSLRRDANGRPFLLSRDGAALNAGRRRAGRRGCRGACSGRTRPEAGGAFSVRARAGTSARGRGIGRLYAYLDTPRGALQAGWRRSAPAF